MNTLKVIKAGNGDSLLMRFLGDDSTYKNILIDGGNKKSEYRKYLKSEIIEIQNNKEYIDLLVITHTDQDHVKGIQYLLEDEDIDKSIIKNVWFNNFFSSYFVESNDISYIESCKIQNLLESYQIPRNNKIIADDLEEFVFFGAKITILSPYMSDLQQLISKNELDISTEGNDYRFSIRELVTNNSRIFVDKSEDLDQTLENRVSIAFLFEINDTSILFLGDANPDIIVNSIRKLLVKKNQDVLVVDYVKLSHHASHRSISLEMTKLISSNQYIVSSNRLKSNLPNKLSFAKILNRKNKGLIKDHFYFNYSDEEVPNDKRLNFSAEEMAEFGFEYNNPNYKNGYLIKHE
ncbi:MULTISPECIES: ComEC/Rec2 family competence protein [Chryseobacterium]|uniref:Beta-lactamase superfamily II metal-dependent hydrolase n=2 Tax=Chryseobacterium TaxID=59732 RepID=A0A543EJH7_9FLAO|nr:MULTISPECIES: hypothetical protein [Chryseobacterium]MDR6458199.1 beta-lactamase superfamily II metal-dependent hydrolase [Chryseobacterium vietnamense]TQM21747.1 beta-lactamase superfamily II metal-dependent hydrolase [Chryseobacterium aquifrigidense]